MRVLLTGGAGYIGSHTAVALLEEGHDVIILDNFANSSPRVISRIETITHRAPELVEVDLTQSALTESALSNTEFDAVIHFAGLKAVGDSVAHPLEYYRTNLEATLVLLEIMAARGVQKLIFSSSATVYGNPQSDRISEDHSTMVGITNPYGWSKAMNEQIICDVASVSSDFVAVLLRYFNPVGAHPTGLIGEDPSGTPNNLMPFVAQVAIGLREKLSIFGNTYDTIDGTGVRDYIHVMDLAMGHVAALELNEPGTHAFNLGSGQGISVLEAVQTFESVTGVSVPYEIVDRRAGDVASVIADPTLVNQKLNWQVARTFADACRDGWAWQSKNPQGYDG
jgi:UDP-glucose 4-epimerase